MSDGEEDFVKFGNALEPYDEDNVPRKKPVTIQDQYAVDEQGRRRFHGAFTGGFSAGYFNTVGTRDGWKPQQFKSSRSSKAGSFNQRPEDFMDQEDTSEFGIAPTAIRTTNDFQDQSKRNLKRIRSRQINNGPIPGTPVLQDFLVPARERIGIKLLKKMGWKPGQGVGPRITKQEKSKLQKRNELLEKYGCESLSNVQKLETSDSDLSDDEYRNILLAPSDYEIKKPEPKDNFFGIGYVGLEKRSILSQHINLFDEPVLHIKDKNNKKLSIRGQAFGVGAFETNDEDIYSREDMSNYDFSLESKPKKKSRWSDQGKSSNISTCLEGFVPAKNPYKLGSKFDPPVLPKDFKPIHTFRQSRFYPPIEAPSSSSKKDQPMLNAQSRARILADATPSESQTSASANLIIRTLNLHGKEKVEERKKQQEQILKAKTSWLEKLRSPNFVKGGVFSSDPSEKGSLKSLGEFTKSCLSNWGESSNKTEFEKPFAADLDKQKRFDEYMKLLELGQEEKLGSMQPLSMSEWDRNQEQKEFEQAAKLKKNLNSASGSTSESENINLEELEPEDAMCKAAKMKMFGKLTRKREIWQPSSIICKRFNVPEPSVGCTTESGKKTQKFSVFDSLNWTANDKFQKSSNKNMDREIPDQQETTKIYETSKIEMEVEKTEKEKVFEASYQKVFQIREKEDEVVDVVNNLEEKKDLFKAIFLSSSEDSESEDDEETVDKDVVKEALIGKPVTEVNVQRNTSPPRGIFAKLDLESINASLRKNPEEEDELKKAENIELKERTNKSSEKEEENLASTTYGPVLPQRLISASTEPEMPKPVFRSVAVPKVCDLLSRGQWVEKSKLKKSKKEKKKHKHKEKSKHKRKSKKEKH